MTPRLEPGAGSSLGVARAGQGREVRCGMHRSMSWRLKGVALRCHGAACLAVVIDGTGGNNRGCVV